MKTRDQVIIGRQLKMRATGPADHERVMAVEFKSFARAEPGLDRQDTRIDSCSMPLIWDLSKNRAWNRGDEEIFPLERVPQ